MSDKANKEKSQEHIKIRELEEKVSELENNWKRALADYKNFEKRTLEDKESWKSFSNEMLIRRILPVLDNLWMLQKHLNDEGLGMIVKEFCGILKDFEVSEVETKDREFNSDEMEAVEMVPGERNKVIETLAKGYFLKNKLIRPARVRVGSGEGSPEMEV